MTLEHLKAEEDQVVVDGGMSLCILKSAPATTTIDHQQGSPSRTEAGGHIEPSSAADPKKPKDPWFDQWLYAKGDPLKGFVQAFLMSLADPSTAKKRRRNRSARAQFNYQQTVETLIANLAYPVVNPSETGRLVVPQNTGAKRTRYDNPALPPKQVKTVVQVLDGLALDLSVGQRGGRASTVTPTLWFTEQVVELGISFEDFGRREEEEVVILSRTDKYLGRGEDGIWGMQKNRERLDYIDTPETSEYRSQIRRLNAFLAEADIVFLDDGLEPRVDPTDRTLRRYFSHTGHEGDPPAFDKHGRLFGGFWTNLKKERRSSIRIDGEPVVLLDYANMVPRLAYAHVGQVPPEGDLYDLTGLLPGYDNNLHRDGVKQALNSLFNGGRARKREILDGLPNATKARAAESALAKKHPCLASLFGSKVGLTLMFMESRILLGVLDQLMREQIAALPLHDGLLVAKRDERITRRVMQEVAWELTGAEIPVASHILGCSLPAARSERSDALVSYDATKRG